MEYMFSRADVHALGDIWFRIIYSVRPVYIRIFMRKPCRKPKAVNLP